jgi:nicotinamidase-related amidase
MLEASKTALVFVDVQGKLAQLMHEKQALFSNLVKLVEGAKVLELPIVWMEQNPDGLGPTIPEAAEAMPEGLSPIPKFSFSCCGEPEFVRALEATGRRQVLICGIESHICVFQTTLELIGRGYGVQVVADAVSSRAAGNRELGLARMKEAGATLTSVEMALFEMLRVAQGYRFKQIVKIVK